MTAFEFNWHIPCGGDSRWICVRAPERPPSVKYLTRVAQAAEDAGFDRVLVPCAFSNGTYGLGHPYIDAFTLGTACLSATSRLRVLIAHRPGFVNPGVFAHMCATADEWTGGRMELNVVTAGAPGDMEQFGDELDHDARYDRAGEFVDVVRRLWSLEPVDYEGRYYRMRGARLAAMPAQATAPPIHLVGASPAAVEMAARQADVYMMQAHTLADVAERVQAVRQRAEELGRAPRFAVSARIYAAETEEEAHEKVRQVLAHADLSVARDRASSGRDTVSDEDLRLRASSSLDSFIEPNVWAGVSHLVHGTAWVGSYESISDLFCRYAELGVTVFQMFGHPYLEEAYHIGERLLPLTKQKLRSYGLDLSSVARNGAVVR